MKIYDTNHRHAATGRVYRQFTVVYSQPGADGRRERVRRFFSSAEAAIEEAKPIASQIERGEREVLKLTNTDAESYTRAMRTLESLDVPLHTAVAEYAHAAGLLAGKPLAEAVKDYMQRQRGKVVPRTVSEVVDELLGERHANSQRYQQSLRSHLRRFRAAFGVEIGKVTTLQMEAWLAKMGGAERTRNNLRSSLVTLFHFARKRGYLPRGVATEAEEIERGEVAASVAKIYSPEQIERL